MASALAKLGALPVRSCRMRLCDRNVLRKCIHSSRNTYACLTSIHLKSHNQNEKIHPRNNNFVSSSDSKRRCIYTTSSTFSITRFVPLSSKTLFKKLVQDVEKSDVGSLGLLEKFTFGVDHAIANTNYSHLPEMKLLYDPLNPDNTSLASRSFTNKEIFDREFWFLQKFTFHLDKAGFMEIDKGDLLEKLAEKPVGRGVIADVKTNQFEILRYWVLGDLIHTPSSSPPSNSSSSSLANKLSFLLGEQSSRKLYKRVVVASRLKNEKKLSLKLYKDIPTNQLHLLLPPSGGLRMHPTYRNLILYSTSLSAFFLCSRYIAIWLLGNNHHLGYVPISFSAFFGITGVALWSLYKQRQKRYLTDILDVIYDHFVVGNQNILPVVMDKCQEELLKGVLLSYYFLSTADRTGGSVEKIDVDNAEGAELTKELLENNINKWLESETGQTDVKFNCSDSLKWLTEIGISSTNPQNGVIEVLPLHNAIKLLPVNNLASSSFPSVKVDEFDLFHGDLAEATNLERQDLVDKIVSGVWSRVNRFQRRF